MTKTRSDIAQKALRKLGILSEEQQPSGYQQSVAEAGVDAAYSEMADREIAWFDIQAVPDGIAAALAQYVAGEIADEFVSEQRAVFFKSLMPSAIVRIAAGTGPDNSGHPICADDF